MSNDEKGYNGWRNYATWRVNLEIFDGMDWDECGKYKDISALGEALKEMADDAVSNYGEITEGLALDYASAFLSEVDWYEIARHIIDDYPQVLEANDEEEKA